VVAESLQTIGKINSSVKRENGAESLQTIGKIHSCDGKSRKWRQGAADV
jgi:hypothetical protein